MICGKFARTARWTLIALGLRPFSTGYAGVAGLVVDRYCAVTQRTALSYTICIRAFFTTPVMLSAVPMPTSVTDWKFASGVERMINVVVA